MEPIGSKNVLRGIGLNLVKKIRDLIFPVFCLSCKKEGEVVCSACLKKVKSEPQFFCPSCYQNNLKGETCLNCLVDSFLDGAFSLGVYKNKVLQAALVDYKYNFNQDAQVIFKQLIADWVQKNPKVVQDFFEQKMLLIPVPLHSSRLWERGFNQAEQLAKILAEETNCSYQNDWLVRFKKTSRQVGLGRGERQQNLSGAFKVKKNLAGETIILIDDVFTTGSTLQECAKVLKQAGAKKVLALALLREN